MSHHTNGIARYVVELGNVDLDRARRATSSPCWPTRRLWQDRPGALPTGFAWG